VEETDRILRQIESKKDNGEQANTADSKRVLKNKRQNIDSKDNKLTEIRKR
jgi:hypothetical protein